MRRFCWMMVLLWALVLPAVAWAKPDLVVEKFELNPPKPAAAKPFQIKVSIKNLGPDRAGRLLSPCAFSIYAYADGQKIGEECDSFGLAGKSTEVYTINVKATGVPTSGAKKIRIFVDATRKVSESKETNNTLEKTITFTRQGPDLVVNRVWTFPSPPRAGSSARVYAEIQNVGSDPVTSAFVVRFTIGTTKLGDVRVFSLASGAKRVLSVLTTQRTAGFKTVTVEADADKKIPEISETNNKRSQRLVWVQNLPDLTVLSITLSPSKPVAGANVTISTRIQNRGVVRAGGITNAPVVRFYVDGKAVGDERISLGLGAGDTNVESVTIKVPTAGLHTILVRVDPDNKIKESVESNNTRTARFTWTAPLPDYQAFSLVVNPGSPIVGQPSTFVVGVKNIGPTSARASVSVDFYLDGRKLGSKSLTALRTGRVGYVFYRYTVTSAAGPHKIKAVVNPSKTLKELTYTNNTIEKSFTWGKVPLPDLVVSLVATAPAKPVIKQRVTLVATIKNQGSKSVGVGTPAFYVRFFIDGRQITQQSKFLSLAAGASSTFRTTVTLSVAGPHKIKVVVDPTDRVRESDEKNNQKEISVTWQLAPQPDFTIVSFYTIPKTVTVGKSFRMYARVTNQGTAAYSKAIAVRFSAAGNVLKPDYGLATGLGIKQIRVPNIAFQATKEGPLLLKVEIDPDKKVAERDEKNNIKELTIKVQKATIDNDKDGVPADKDCDDNNKAIFPAYNGKPAAKEVCNNKDDNCDGKTDEGFDKDGDGVSTCAATPDCKDDDKTVFPGAKEVCNNKDDNCDGKTDENLRKACSTACGSGNEVCVAGKYEACDAPAPQKEVCDGKDNDCNGVPDDGQLCQAGEVCRAGTCIQKPPCDPACKANETCVQNQCVPKDPCANVNCKATEECKAGQCIPKEPADSEPNAVELPPTEWMPEDAGATTPDTNITPEPDSGAPDNGNDNPDPGSGTPDNGSAQPDSGNPAAGESANSNDLNVAPGGGCSCSSQGPVPTGSWLLFLLFVCFLGRHIQTRRTR